MTLSSWSGAGVRVADVLEELESLRRPDVMPATRTSVLTLVLVARSREAAREAMAGVYELGGRHPARVLSVVAHEDGDGEAGIDAEVRLLGGEAEGHPLWFEDVELVVRGPAAQHLDSLIEPFTLADLPVVVWFADELPAPDDPLLRAADVALVDARSFGDTECFDVLGELARRVPVVDLSWHRLRPWRELLGSLFESPYTKPFLSRIVSARVAGRTGPRHVLAGWLIDCLELPLPEVHLDAATHVSMSLVGTSPDGRRGTFEVLRPTDERVVMARAAIEGGPTAETLVPLPPPTPGWGVAAALSHLDRDLVYERALRSAMAVAARQ